MNNPTLLKSIENYKLFCTRLNKTLNVSYLTLIEDILPEYKKFTLLSAKYSNMVPSKIIDSVWHEHILWTEDYEAYCKSITSDGVNDGIMIHHRPGSDENTEYNNMYMETLNLYFTEFGEYPKARVWFYHDIRSKFRYNLSSKPQLVKVNKSHHKRLDMLFDPIELYWYGVIISDNTLNDNTQNVDLEQDYTVDTSSISEQSDNYDTSSSSSSSSSCSSCSSCSSD